MIRKARREIDGSEGLSTYQLALAMVRALELYLRERLERELTVKWDEELLNCCAYLGFGKPGTVRKNLAILTCGEGPFWVLSAGEDWIVLKETGAEKARRLVEEREAGL